MTSFYVMNPIRVWIWSFYRSKALLILLSCLKREIEIHSQKNSHSTQVVMNYVAQSESRDRIFHCKRRLPDLKSNHSHVYISSFLLLKVQSTEEIYFLICHASCSFSGNWSRMFVKLISSLSVVSYIIRKSNINF